MRRFLDDRVIHLRNSDFNIAAFSLRSISMEVGRLRYCDLWNFLLITIRGVFSQDRKLTVLI